MSRIDRAFARYCETRDPHALARVFDAVAPDLLRLARHLAPQAAEDVLQDTFLTAIERADTFATERRVLPWLFGILVHRARMLRRGAARARPADGAGDVTAIDRAPAPPTLAEHREAEHRLREAVAALPARYRELMVATLEEGLTPAELATRLQRNPSTVRTQLARGLEELQRRLPALAVGALTVAPGGANAATLLRVRARVVPGIAAAKRAVHLGWLAAAVVCISAGLAALWPATPEPTVTQVVAEAPAIDAPAPAPAAPLERAAAAPVDPSDAPRAANSSTIEVRGRCVDAASATPLADCAVELQSRSRNELMDLLFGPFANAQASMRTGSDGTFTLRVDDHPGTDHAIDVRAPGRALYRCRIGPDLAGSPLRGPIDLGDLRVEAGVELVGRVTDPDGRPIEGVYLGLWWRTHAPPFDEHCPGNFTTDAEGRWTPLHSATLVPPHTFRTNFAAVLHDSYTVNFNPPVALGPIPLPDTRLVDGRLRLDLVLRRPVEIRGRVVDAAGAALPGVGVFARSNTNARRLAQGRSRDDGTFRLIAPADTPGPVELITDAPCELLEPGPTVAWGSSDHVLRARCAPREATTGLTVELRVTDAVSGQPVERFGYRLDPPRTAGRQSSDGRLYGIGDHAGGILRVETIPAGDYSLELVPSHRHEPLRREVNVPPTGAVLDFAVQPATHRELAVLVRDSSGQPVPGAEVELLEPLPGHTIEVHTPALPRYATGGGHRALQRGKGVTDGEGHGTLDVRIVRGVETFVVRVRSATHPPLLLPGVRLPAPGAALAIDLPAGAALLARLDPPTLMLLAPHLRVLDADGRRLAKAGGANGNGALPFAADGTLRIDGLAPGNIVLELVTVTQSGPFAIPQRLALLPPVAVRAGAVTEVPVRVPQLEPGTLRGRVVRRGQPDWPPTTELGLQSLQTANLPNPAPGMPTHTYGPFRADAEGRFELALPPGRYRLLQWWGSVAAEGEVVIERGQTREFSFVMP